MKQDISFSPYFLIENSKITSNIENQFYIGNISSEMEFTTYPFKTSFYVCCICSSGESRGRINLLPYTLKSLSMSINIPGQIIEHKSMSPDFNGICILMSSEFVSSLGLPYNFQTYMSVQETPILSLTKNQYNAMISYCNMVQRIISINHPNKMEIIKHLTCAFFYGIGHYFHITNESIKLSNEEIIMQDFLKLVQQNYRQERKVLFYADALHLSASYVSTVIKNTSGKTASEWINDYVALEAKYLLKFTNMTIQQISDKLNFPSQSFFGKYFKRQIGISPKEYRNK